ncbi:MAG: coenzyme F420-0:L-glutamate ligase [Rhodospirillaceae bacterium]|nr:coenzyme F420-0:L-glutamate ligase [Rhodospirillaceae bacterium]
MPSRMILTALTGVPEVTPGDDLVQVVADSINVSGEILINGDILVVAQKIVSKAEGRIVDFDSVKPSQRALVLAEQVDKDPRHVELVLQESNEVVKYRPGVLIVEQKLGLVMANAGIDHSNIQQNEAGERILLLPVDPDASANRLKDGLRKRFDVSVGIVINDSVGRAWRIGTVGLAIGVAGLPAVLDLRGEPDRHGRELLVSEQAVADELASAASLLQGQAAEGLPIVLVRGFSSNAPEQGADALIRSREMDMFR